MKDFIDSLQRLASEFSERLAKLEKRDLTPLFRPRVTVAKTPELIDEQESDVLGLVQQFRPAHGPGIFLVRLLARLMVAHSLVIRSGSEHVHGPTTWLMEPSFPDDDVIHSSQIVRRERNGVREVWLIEYVADKAIPDPLHPEWQNVFDTDENHPVFGHVRVLKTTLLKQDGRFVVSDHEERRSMK